MHGLLHRCLSAHRGRIAARSPLLLALVALLAGPALLLAGQDYERWYTVELAGQPAGYMQAVRATEGDLITTSSRVVMSIGRGDVNVSITMEGQFIETVAGKPVSMLKVEQLGMLPTRTEYTFDEGQIRIRSVQGQQVSESTRPLPEGAWLTPAAAESFVRQRLAAGAERIEVRTIEPMSGHEPSLITRTGITPVTTELLGRRVQTFRSNVVSSATPGIASTEYLDASGIPVKLTTSIGPLAVSMSLSDRETALASGKGALAPELMQRTFIRPDQRIRSPRTTTRAVFVLSIPDGQMPDIPSTAVQTVEALAADRTRITINLNDPVPAPKRCRENPAYLESSGMLNTDDPEIIALAERSIRDAGDDRASRAEAMRRAVYQFIRSKDLDVGFATASEVVRSRRGDCTEHAVLLAAMLRTQGIPARVVSGLIYADRFAGERHILGYHMWTQALLPMGNKFQWVDLDATLPGGAFDATHIALATSALRDGETAGSMSAMLPLIGQLQVTVEEYQ